MSVSAPFIGTTDKAGINDGGDGWFTMVLGLLVVLIGGLILSGRRIAAIPPIAIPISGAVAALGLTTLAVFEVVNIRQKVSELRSDMASGDDALGIGRAMNEAVQVNVGTGLWLIILGGVVAAEAAAILSWTARR